MERRREKDGGEREEKTRGRKELKASESWETGCAGERRFS